jgi:hypothetical protein
MKKIYKLLLFEFNRVTNRANLTQTQLYQAKLTQIKLILIKLV